MILSNLQYALTKIEPHPSRRRGMLSFSVPHGQPVIPIYASAFITGRKHFGLDTHHYLVEGWNIRDSCNDMLDIDK